MCELNHYPRKSSSKLQLLLQRVEAVPVQGQLLLELVQQVGRDPVGLGASVGHGTVVPGVVVGAVVHPGKGAAGHVVSQRHRQHHAVRVDGGPRGAAVTLHRAALGRAEQVGLPRLRATVQVAVAVLAVLGGRQATGVAGAQRGLVPTPG